MKNFFKAWAVWLPLLVFVGLCAVFVQVLLLGKQGISQTVYKPMPAFRLASLEQPEKFYTDKDVLGEITVVNFWATWCPPCRQEHPVLVKIAQDYDVRMVGVNYKDKSADALGWLKDLGNPYQFTLADPNGRTGIDWGVVAIPETFLVDAQGVVRYKHTGPITNKIWEDEIWPLICKWSDNRGTKCVASAS
ncbi:MAG: DsbE family thiol:disulfide interchange protein [Gammaproteobacteria bacterium]